MRRRRAVLLGLGAAILIFLLTDGFVAPPAHDVHSPGGAAIKVTFFESNQAVTWFPSPPSQSLSRMKCALLTVESKCDAATLAGYYPNLAQSDHTLYLIWPYCVGWSGHGEITSWQGYNVEYSSSRRSLLIHCFRSKPWLYAHSYLFGVAAVPRYALATLSTVGIASGTISIVEDDRLEHLVGDQSTESQLGTVTI